MSATYERSDSTSSGQFVNAKMHDMNDIRTHFSNPRDRSQLLPEDSDIPSCSSGESTDSEDAAIEVQINDSTDDEDYVGGQSRLNKRTTATEIDDSYDYYQWTREWRLLSAMIQVPDFRIFSSVWRNGSNLRRSIALNLPESYRSTTSLDLSGQVLQSNF